jgi:hypothetical protein
MQVPFEHPAFGLQLAHAAPAKPHASFAVPALH